LKRGAFLDRDGVINETIFHNGINRPPNSIDEIIIIDGVTDAIQILEELKIIPIIVTNQPDVARGTATQMGVNKINTKIKELTGIQHVYTCFHDDLDNCLCRKPKPGLLLKATEDLILDLSKSFLVGDRWRDIEAGQILGLDSFFIDNLKNKQMPVRPYTRVQSLFEAVNLIMRDSDDF
jgi:D-glycero-D-manno-heptose 1,7-bisphosphate phosphatase